MTNPTTVVVVNWNTVDHLRRCLTSLEAEVQKGGIELVVVDNGSQDGSPELVENEFASVATLLRSEGNIGFGRAANLGASRTASKWLVICNADVEVSDQTIGQLIAIGEDDPRVGLVAPCLVNPAGEPQESVFRFPRLTFTALAAIGVHRLGGGFERWLFHGARAERAGTVLIEYAMGAFIVVRRSAFEEVGGFACDQWMYAEDLDLGWRLRRAGWNSVYVPYVQVVHVRGAATSKAFGAASGTSQVVSAYYHWLRTRRGLVRMWAVAAIEVAAASGRLAAYSGLSLFGKGKESRARTRRWLAMILAAARAA